MKYIYIRFLVLCMLIANAASGCDMCNCYLGLNPHSKKNSIGLRTFYSYYTGSHEEYYYLQQKGINSSDISETRSRTEVHGQFFPLQKLKILFAVPFIVSRENSAASGHVHDDSHSHSQDVAVNDEYQHEVTGGIGDPYIILHYQLFNAGSGRFMHRSLAGGGIKMPLGKWRINSDDEHERSHKPGTGSWDYILSAEYLAKYRAAGLNVSGSYVLNSVNDQRFRFGNRLNVNSLFYYSLSYKKLSFYPCAGFYYEMADKDKSNEGVIRNSGGSIFYGQAGFDIYFKKISFNTALQLPVSSEMNLPQPELKYKLIAGFGYAF